MSATPPQVWVAAGLRKAERLVLRWVDENRPREVAALAAPLCIVVPSRSLRRHLLAVLVRRLGGLAGVEVLTHRALARRVLERAGEPPPPGGRTHELLARRFAASSPVLGDALGGLEDGYGAVVAAVRDLLDAGFEPESWDAAREAVRAAQARLGRAAVARAEAVLEVAARCALAERETGLSHRGSVLRRAEALLGTRPELVGPGPIMIHGFAEATALVSQLLERLVRIGAVVVVDQPPDPAEPEHRDAGWRFTARLVDRLLGPGGAARLSWSGAEQPEVSLEAFAAPGPEAEAREVAERVASLLEAGADPARVAVVARRLDVARLAVYRRQFGRLAVPFSGEGAAVPAGAAAARVRAATELLGRGSEAPAAAWLEAARVVEGVPDVETLGLALRAAGIGRLGEAAGADLASLCRGGKMLLPVVERVEEDEATGGGRRHHAAIAGEALEAGRRAAAALADLLGQRPSRAPVKAHLEWVRRVFEALGWHADREGAEAFHRPLGHLEAELPGELEVAWEHLWPVLVRELGAAGEPAGGRGGGVQLLSVMEARGRTFDHLFLVGLNRNEFPRQPTEDPVLPDAVRRVLVPVLPELPLKGQGRTEDRYYFAQLVHSAPAVTLSWCTVNAEGEPLARSALVERLFLAGRLERVTTVRDLAVRPHEPGRPRPLVEHAVAAALAGDRARLAAAARLAGVAGEGGHLVAVLDELDPPGPRSGLGPYLGLVASGPPATLAVTRLEQFIDCPWKHHLERALGLEAPPDPRLSGVRFRGRLVGSAVHRALERLGAAAGAPAHVALETIRDTAGVRLKPPGRDQLREVAHHAAREVALEEGVPGLAPAVAARVHALLELARRRGWLEADDLLGVEARGRVEVAGWSLEFRADRVERGAEGELVLVDYKTGDLSRWNKAPTEVARGRALQGAVYARAGGVGRYLPLEERSETRYEVKPEDAGSLEEVVETARAAWETGWAVPRLADAGGKTPRVCSWCEVAEACLQGDSGARRRLVGALSTREEDPRAELWRWPR